MKLNYEFTQTISTKYEDQHGAPLFERTITITSTDSKIEGVLPELLFQYPYHFTAANEVSAYEYHVKILENTFAQMYKYFDCLGLIRLRADIAYRQLKSLNEKNSSRLKELRQEMSDLQQKLAGMSSEYKYLIASMGEYGLSADTVTVEWVKRQLMYVELHYQEALLDDVLGGISLELEKA